MPTAYKMTSNFSDTLGKEIKLGKWVTTQKKTLKSGKLDEKLKGRLERIGLKLPIGGVVVRLTSAQLSEIGLKLSIRLQG